MLSMRFSHAAALTAALLCGCSTTRPLPPWDESFSLNLYEAAPNMRATPNPNNYPEGELEQPTPPVAAR